MNDKSKTKQQALRQIQTIAQENQLSSQVIFDFLNQNNAEDTKGGLFTRVLGYLGGIFLLGGLVAYAMMFWEQMGPGLQLTVTLIAGFAIFVTVAIFNLQERMHKISTPLYIVAFLLQVTGLFVFLSLFYESTNRWQEPTLFVFGLLLTQQFLVFLALQRGVLLFHSIICLSMCIGAVGNIISLDDSFIFLIIGLFYLVSSYAIDKTNHRAITPFWYFFGGAFTLGAMFDLLKSAHVDFLFLLPSCFFVYLSTLVHSRSLLFVSVISIFSFLGYFTTRYFTDSIGWPLSLIILGLLLFGLSSLGYKLSKRI